VEAVRRGFKEDGGVRVVEQRTVEEATYIARIANAWRIEQDVFAVCESLQCPFETIVDVDGNVNGLDDGIVDELCAV
jgi:hypothetical protein